MQLAFLSSAPYPDPLRASAPGGERIGADGWPGDLPDGGAGDGSGGFAGALALALGAEPASQGLAPAPSPQDQVFAQAAPGMAALLPGAGHGYGADGVGGEQAGAATNGSLYPQSGKALPFAGKGLPGQEAAGSSGSSGAAGLAGLVQAAPGDIVSGGASGGLPGAGGTVAAAEGRLVFQIQPHATRPGAEGQAQLPIEGALAAAQGAGQPAEGQGPAAGPNPPTARGANPGSLPAELEGHRAQAPADLAQTFIDPAERPAPLRRARIERDVAGRDLAGRVPGAALARAQGREDGLAGEGADIAIGSGGSSHLAQSAMGRAPGAGGDLARLAEPGFLAGDGAASGPGAAGTSPSATSDPRGPLAVDLADLVDRLLESRVQARAERSEIDLPHPDFGRVTLALGLVGEDGISLDLPDAPGELRLSIGQALAAQAGHNPASGNARNDSGGASGGEAGAASQGAAHSAADNPAGRGGQDRRAGEPAPDHQPGQPSPQRAPGNLANSAGAGAAGNQRGILA